MVTIILIKTEKGISYYHCLPENKESGSFDLGIDLNSREIVSNTLGKKNSYSAHAAWKVCDIYEETKEIPEKEVAAWV